ncbi:MAG: LLM class F420-dependent oxidoreductase [Dehalococcoidia bacterium]
MKVGLQIVRFDWPGGTSAIAPRLRETAEAAEDAGFSSLWLMDHFLQIPPLGPEDDPMVEGYNALSFLASVTSRMRLGALVTGATYREPALLLKSVTSVDVLSGGRANLGIGAAWFEREAQALGLPFPPLKERFERLEEVLQIAHRMWSGDRSPYHGTHYTLEEPINSPLPLSQPHPPILIGGSGEQKTLRLVAQYGDACNFFAADGPEVIWNKLNVLLTHCERLGRDYETIERTALGNTVRVDTPQAVQELIEVCKELAKVGVQHIIFSLEDAHSLRPIETFKREVIPALAEL